MARLPLLLAVLSFAAGADAQELQRLPCNHPGLVVDLGVGLWAWPLPMDFDGDGDLDLVVNCPDKPSNGVYFFENATGDTAKNPLSVFKAGRRISRGLQSSAPINDARRGPVPRGRALRRLQRAARDVLGFPFPLRPPG